MAGPATSAQVAARKDRLLTRDDVEALIAEGRTVMIIDGKVLKVDPWLKYHPGGDKAIMHMVGRDATDEVNALHSSEARLRMKSYQIGRIEGRWANFLPPIQGGQYRTRDEIAAERAAMLQDTREQDSSSQGSSAEPSPIFEPADLQTHRRRTPRASLSRSSSATSVSSLGLADEDENMDKSSTAASAMEKRTQQEIQHDLDKYPNLDARTQAEIGQKYRLLHDRIRAEGLYDCNYTAYAIELSRYTFLAVMFLLTLRWAWYKTSAVFLGLLWHQLVFTVHDAGHMGITHNYQVDTTIGMFIASYIGGLSLGWWKHNHNVHHIVTNSPEHDPDIEHMPFFAISHRFFDSLRSTYYDRIMTYDPFAKFMIRYQHYLYYVILTFGRFNLYRLSWAHLLFGKGPRKGPAAWHRWFELAGQVVFWAWFGYGVVYASIPGAWNRIAFVLISHAVTMPLHVQITLSHFAMSTADLGVAESFPQRMLRTTMDVDCPQWLDFVHGGLQFQAIHHLYPRMPRHNLRAAQKLVQAFCEDTGIPYALYGFVDGNREVIGRLGEVAQQARLLGECQKVMAEKGEFGH